MSEKDSDTKRILYDILVSILFIELVKFTFNIFKDNTDNNLE